jgi:hypothetical protein
MRMKTTKDKGNAADERFSSLFILDPFDGARPPLLRVKKRRSGSTLSPSALLGALSLSKGKPGPLVRQAHHPERSRGTGRGVEGVTLLVERVS